ncbi:MAG TPA: Spy/CpxP family protein refolding chaperone [Gemmatimonadaceae bacterium]
MKHIFVRVAPALALALCSIPLAAQQPAAPGRPPMTLTRQMPRSGNFRMAGRGMMAGSPAQRLLGMRTQLGLTDDQVARLEALSTAQRQALAPQMPAELRVRADLMEAMQKDNLDAAHTAIDRMAKMRADAQFARLKAARDARDILTDAQRTKLQQFRGAMMRGRMMRGGMMRRGMMRGGMMNGGMMRGGMMGGGTMRGGTAPNP